MISRIFHDLSIRSVARQKPEGSTLHLILPKLQLGARKNSLDHSTVSTVEFIPSIPKWFMRKLLKRLRKSSVCTRTPSRSLRRMRYCYQLLSTNTLL